jgi:hypothetical protein
MRDVCNGCIFLGGCKGHLSRFCDAPTTHADTPHGQRELGIKPAPPPQTEEVPEEVKDEEFSWYGTLAF